MELFDTVNEHLGIFGEKAGLEGLELDDDGICPLAFGEGDDAVQVNVEVLPEENRTLFHARVGELGAQPKPETLLAILDLNLYAIGTGGGSLGVDQETGEAILTFSWIFDDLDYGRFEKLLETTYAAATYVRGVLAQLQGGGDDKGRQGAPPGGPMHHGGPGANYFVIQG